MQKLEPLCTVGRIVNGTAVMENLMAVLQKIKNMIKLYDLAFPLLGIYPKELKAEF